MRPLQSQWEAQSHPENKQAKGISQPALIISVPRSVQPVPPALAFTKSAPWYSERGLV